MDRGAWQAAVHRSQRVGHDWRALAHTHSYRYRCRHIEKTSPGSLFLSIKYKFCMDKNNVKKSLSMLLHSISTIVNYSDN